jgi:hypothetical protein
MGGHIVDCEKFRVTYVSTCGAADGGTDAADAGTDAAADNRVVDD